MKGVVSRSSDDEKRLAEYKGEIAPSPFAYAWSGLAGSSEVFALFSVTCVQSGKELVFSGNEYYFVLVNPKDADSRGRSLIQVSSFSLAFVPPCRIYYLSAIPFNSLFSISDHMFIIKSIHACRKC